MKKIYKTKKWRKFNKNRSLKSIKKKRKRKNKSFIPSKGVDIIERKPTQNIIAPAEFSLINNTEKVLEYFHLARNYLKSGYPIRFDISEIETLTPDAIILQIARIKDEKFHNKKGITGNAPNNPDLKKLFLESGFYNHVNIKGNKPNGKDTLIHKITKNKVEPQLAKQACLIGLKHAFQNEDIFDPMFDILIEIMQNTNNHAGETRGEYDWWLHIYNEPNTQIAKYTFVDLGIGIFESIPAQNFKRKIGQAIGLINNTNLVKPLFNGEIKSRTARPERGKGIPQVYEASQHESFSKFIMISNDVHVNMKNLTTKKLNNNFSGTLFYWELKK
jgi:hypothetical protein